MIGESSNWASVPPVDFPGERLSWGEDTQAALVFVDEYFELFDVGLFEGLGDELDHVGVGECLVAVFHAVGAGDDDDLGFELDFFGEFLEGLQE